VRSAKCGIIKTYFGTAKAQRARGIQKGTNIDYDPKLEQDVQDIFITSLAIKNDRLVVVNERKESYEIDLQTRKIFMITVRLSSRPSRLRGESNLVLTVFICG
jgi:hypothetical protein